MENFGRPPQNLRLIETFETSALESLYGGQLQITLSILLIKPDFHFKGCLPIRSRR